MAFVRAAAPLAAPPPVRSKAELVALLASPDAAARRHAARALADKPAAAPALASRLDGETEASVREALFGSLVDIGGAKVAALIAPRLRSADAGLRNDALEALKQLDEAASATAVDALLADDSADVRLLAIEITRAWSSRRAGPRLRRIIETDPHVNVCGAAVDVATEVGTTELLGPLAALRLRFAEEAFLVFSVDVATSRILRTDGQEASAALPIMPPV